MNEQLDRAVVVILRRTHEGEVSWRRVPESTQDYMATCAGRELYLTPTELRLQGGGGPDFVFPACKTLADLYLAAALQDPAVGSFIESLLSNR